ncbi:MAG: hypothetical protein NPIRA05_10450 [Nitrospirales bacterium]|nr:MAG: hypothetical protein NPIRA05_10450 [Nitrospirales bacterium]
MGTEGLNFDQFIGWIPTADVVDQASNSAIDLPGTEIPLAVMYRACGNSLGLTILSA